MTRKRLVGTVAMLIGLVLIVGPWWWHPVAGSVEDTAMLASGLALSVLGTTVVYQDTRDRFHRGPRG